MGANDTYYLFLSRNIYELHLRCCVMGSTSSSDLDLPFLHATRHDDSTTSREAWASITILISERASAWDPTVVSAHCNLQVSSFVPISLRPWRGTWVRGQVTRHCRPCAGRSGS